VAFGQYSVSFATRWEVLTVASLDDILSAQKNGVIAINSVVKSNQRGQGIITSATVTTGTLIVAGAGYLVSYTVVVAGSANGLINNANTVAGATATNALCATDKTSVGVYKVGLAYTDGIVIVPGTGQSINVTYSPG
jgi:hypothetical protein